MTGSETLLARMVGNVLDNAIIHNEPRGWVRISTSVAGAAARLTVQNGGRVLDERDVQALTQPFRRLGTERTGSGQGSGLGLSIVAAIAEMHGGRLEVHAPRRRRLRSGHRPSPGAASRRWRPDVRVLVVEDTHSLADGIAEGLRDNGMAVDVAYEGQDAAAKLDINAYDVVVLDRDLPGVHGDTICRMIARSDKAVMVLMLTASRSPGDRVSGLSLGADDYLAKPFHFPELVLRIRALARRQPTARSRIFRAAGVELDPLRHTAHRGGRQLDLSAKEFAVLEALMRADHAVLSAEDLLE